MKSIDWWPAPVAGCAALALYGATLAPGLTWAHDGADGGDLLAAALTGGIPHPPGYPAYQLLLRAALALPGAAGNPARTGNWLSAVCAAAAVALLADLARRSLPAARLRSAAALAAALAWAASPALWSQAVITEVYAANALVAVVLLWLLWRWREAAAASGGEAGWRWLALAGLAFGLGLGNHLSLLLMLPGACAWLWSNRRHLAPAPRRAWPIVTVAFGAGLTLYAYLPIAAASNPALAWGDPRLPARLLWLVTAQPYGGLAFGLPWQWLPGRLAAWAGEALGQFWPWGAALAAFGLWRLDRAEHDWWRCTGLIALAFSLYAIGYNTADSYVYLIPAWAAAALWLAWGVAALGNWRVARPGLLLLLVFLLLPVASAAGHFPEMDLRHDRAAEDFVAGTLQAAQPRAVILVATDRPTFALWYAIYGLRQRPDVTPVNVNLLAFPWYRQGLTPRISPAAVPLDESGVPDWPALLDRLADLGPLYRAEPLPLDTSTLRELPAGPLIQLMPGGA